MTDKVRENRIRRLLERRGLALEKSRRRDSGAIDYGKYRVVDPLRNEVIAGAHQCAFELSLDEAEAFATQYRAGNT